jgi:hypothetical protein
LPLALCEEDAVKFGPLSDSAAVTGHLVVAAAGRSCWPLTVVATRIPVPHNVDARYEGCDDYFDRRC